MPTAFTESELCHFTGSENYYRHNMNRNLLFTDGVKFVADTAGAYWLIDEIAIANLFQAQVKAEEFQVWTLSLGQPGSGAHLVCDDGNGNVVFTRFIPFTDFPVESVTFYFENNTLCLPSER